MAKNQRVQQKCFNEIRQIFGNDKMKRAQMNDLNEMHYLDLVIKETLRYMFFCLQIYKFNSIDSFLDCSPRFLSLVGRLARTFSFVSFLFLIHH